MGSGCVDKMGLQPLTALGGVEPARDVIGAVEIVENPGIALASLATRRGQGSAVAAAARAMGLGLPGPGMVSASAPCAALWLGPDQWMVMAQSASHEDLAAVLGTAFGAAASVTEQTGGWVCFDLNGPALPDLFERLCAVDTRAMAVGGGTRTVIEHLGCYVICRAAGQFRVFGPRSSAASLHHALTTAARSIA